MNVIDLLIAIVVTLIVLWLVNLFAPVWIAAVLALLVFFGFVTGGWNVSGRHRP